MSGRPWMPMYWGDYLADTAHLSALEHGAYLLLIAHYWQNHSLPSDETRLARIARLTIAQWRKARPTISEFFSDDWKHARVEFELTECERISEAGRKGGVASGKSRRQAKEEQKQRENLTTVERPANDQPTICEALQPQSQEERIVESAQSAPAKKVSRGTRLPDEWYPSDVDIAFASKQGIRLFEIEIEATKFRNYWTNRSDRGASKLRWDRAWQNWILNIKTPMNGGRNAAPSAGDRARQFASRIREVELTKGIGRPPDVLGGDRDSGNDLGSVSARQIVS